MKNKELPLVTVRMPAYNHEKYVEQAILSVINQTYKNIQLIVVDDGSSDNTPNIIQRLANLYEFTYIRQENKGVCATFNYIFSLSQGDYIFDCASDDYLEYDAIEKMIERAQRSNSDIVYGRVKMIKNDIEFGEIPFSNLEVGVLAKKKDLLIKKYRTPIGSFLYKKELLDKIMPLPLEVKLEDAYLMLKIPMSTSFAAVDSIIKYYRVHDTNTVKNELKMYESKLYILNTYYTRDTDMNGLYYYSSRAGFFKQLASKHKYISLKYMPSAILFIFKSNFSKYAIKQFIVGLLRLININKSRITE